MAEGGNGNGGGGGGGEGSIITYIHSTVDRYKEGERLKAGVQHHYHCTVQHSTSLYNNWKGNYYTMYYYLDLCMYSILDSI